MAGRTIPSALGSTYPIGTEQITLFLPNKDRLGKPIDQEFWTDKTLTALGKLFRGATAFPPGKGVWRDDIHGGELLREITVMVVTYVPREELNENIKNLRVFLHRFGREANQGEVGLVINSSYYGISKYDEP